ncbi:MAG: 16S rRNA (cytidine(1402)-2'-O)-methyltransferase [Alphaproteobacteria bacterium]|nr:16S rRNA (cytidine(1402)-2'-O)-methyltransferase [Alphaproteobacteria bacterium]
MFSDRPDGNHAKPPPGLYLIATPLGNLGDISARAVRLLGSLDLLACEDTRTTRRLCAALGIAAPKLVRYDDHADEAARAQLVAAIRAGQAVGLVCDAGTPLIADPGYRLVRAVRAAGLPVTALPGPAAAITALILSGLPSDRFLFAGFTPRGGGARRSWLAEIKAIKATLVIYESPHRLVDSLADMAAIFGPREAAVARELTKTFEEVRTGTLAELAAHYAEAGAPKGEIVVVIGPPGEGAAAASDEAPPDVEALLRDALAASSLRDAVASVARATGLPRREVYRRALALGAKG